MNVVQEKEKKRLLVRNACWNKHFTDVLDEENNKDKYLELGDKLLEEFKKDERISYCIFSVERGKHQNKQSFHFQGYIEFNVKVDAVVFKKKFELTNIQLRGGTQQEAINYVKKEESKIDSKLWEFGNLKGKLTTFNIKDGEIPKLVREQEVLLNRRIKENYYEKFEDIEKDFEHIYIKQTDWLKNLWNKYHPINILDLKPAKVIWIFGGSGSGKSTFTKKYLREHYDNGDIATISPQNMTYSDKVYFDLNYEDCKVLIINEVDKKFPKYNNLISFIDRNTLLVTKGSHIRNNFDLIVINSIYRPEQVFAYLGRKEATQVIRRIFNKHIDCRVYQIFANQKQLAENKVFETDIEFQDWYKPICKEILEPNYSLIPEKEWIDEEQQKEELIKNCDELVAEKKEQKKSLFNRLKSLFF